MIFSEGQGCCLGRTQNVSHFSVGHLKEQKVIILLINHLFTNATQSNTKTLTLLLTKRTHLAFFHVVK